MEASRTIAFYAKEEMKEALRVASGVFCSMKEDTLSLALKSLFSDWRIPPFSRDRLPFLCLRGCISYSIHFGFYFNWSTYSFDVFRYLDLGLVLYGVEGVGVARLLVCRS